MPISFIKHKGKDILFIDLSESKSEQRSLELLDEVRDAYDASPTKPLVLVNTDGAYVNQKVTAKMKEYGKRYFKDRAEKRAFVGIKGLKKLIFKAYTNVAGGNLKVFDDVEEAKDYLVG